MPDRAHCQTAQLVRRAAAGDAEAFAELVRRYKAAVHGYILSRVQDFAWADDLAQETFIAAFVGLGGLRDRRKFSAWLRAIADNLVKLWLRRMQRDARLWQAAADREKARAPTEPAAEVEEVILSALLQLSPDRAAALTLYYCDGLTQRECAEFLGITHKAMESRLRRARRALKKKVVRMAEQTLKGHSPDESFDAGVMAEVRKLVAVVGGPYKKGPVEQAEQRLAVLFARNEERLSDLIRQAADERQRRAGMRMVWRLGLVGVNRALPLALSADDRARENALAALPTFDRGAFTYTVLEAIDASGISDERKAALLVDLIRRPTLLARHWPRYMRERFAFDSSIYMEMLMRYAGLGVRRLAELIRSGAEKPDKLDPWLARALVRFGTEGLLAVLPWVGAGAGGEAPAVTALELIRLAMEGRLRAALHFGWSQSLREGDLYLLARGRTEPMVHQARMDADALARIGRRAAQAAEADAPAIRQAGVAALGYFDDEVALPALRQGLGGANVEVAVAAARSLGWRCSARRVEILAEALASVPRPVKAAVSDALTRLWSQCHDLIDLRAEPSRQHAWSRKILGTSEELAELVQALDARRERILRAVEKAGLSKRGTLWEMPLPERIDLGVRERTRAGKSSELTRRAREYWDKHPDQRYGQGFFYEDPAAAVRHLPEDRDNQAKELIRLLSFVSADSSGTIREMVDCGWMTRAGSVCRLTELGRRAWRMEHLLDEPLAEG